MKTLHFSIMAGTIIAILVTFGVFAAVSPQRNVAAEQMPESLMGIGLEKTNYYANDTIKVSGDISKQVGPVKDLYIEIRNPNGAIYKSDTIPLVNGKFYYQFKITGKLGVSGAYQARIVNPNYGIDLSTSFHYETDAYIPPSNSDCQNKIAQKEQILSSQVNESKAILLAVNSKQFKSAVNGSDVNFGYVYYRWNTDNVSCSTGLQNVNVLFYVRLSNSITNLVIKEDLTLGKIIGIVESPATYEGACYGPDGCNLFVGIPLQQEMTLLGEQPDNQNSSGLSYQECQDKIGNEMQKIVGSINKSKAILLATSSSDFQSKVNGYKYVFSGIFTNMTENQKTCDAVKLTSIVTEFSILDNTSKFVKFVEVGEDPSLVQVTSVEDVFVHKCDNNCPPAGPPATVTLRDQQPLTPLKQIASGVEPKDVMCKSGLTLVLKAEDQFPACIKPEDASKLIERGWAKITITIADFNVRQ